MDLMNRKPFVHIEVNLGKRGKIKLIVYKGETSKFVAEKFGIKYSKKVLFI